ncbi:MAG TPA: 1-(5-phosphoribosyl)-5-amino-4-imidazole-carboxylate carboxylase, partial [Armatimonadetes bacterium]|nr:1-(5-phosphoribosyl)-5-amino-4-imidazole-carboxylate carboxylase [Armatimonadota bacterium]
MLIERIRSVLEELRAQRISVDEAMRQLRALPYEELGFAKIDHHRLLRRGFPEVILCEGKTIEQIERIVHEQIKHGGLVMATKATREVFEAVQRVAPMAQFHELARIIVIRPTDDETQVAVDEQQRAELPIAVVLSAGTSDIPVAEEAAVTAETLGMRVHRIYDVG